MQTPQLPKLSDGTAAAIANLVDYAIEREYGHDVADVERGARTIALAGLQFDLQAAGTPQEGIYGVAETTLRILLRDGLEARVCQCPKLHPNSCPHGSTSGQLFCGNHFESDVPPLAGALLCGTCHGAEYRAGTPELATRTD